MNTTTLFYVIGCFVDTIQSPYTWQRKKREKERKFNSKNTASSSNQFYLLEYLVFFIRTSRQKKQEKKEKKLEKLLPFYLVYVSHQGRFGQPQQTGGGAGCKRPRQRGTDASFTCVLLRFCRDVRRPRHLPNAKTAAIST